ncbi:hypothetical protein KUCAC02_015457 [Chaenocephalus aceratus]|uniref:Uncharacterized protein n=1 Tax=Chaenocephalus aceratus TaxID=36190 RepID=A0ACB9XXD1_CHAAC|nr:hypothetical protein KUCAC02_015457 [Chaenocephalus aceratus]
MMHDGMCFPLTEDLLKKSDPVERVKDKLDKDEVYVGTRVVISKFHEEGQHAESSCCGQVGSNRMVCISCDNGNQVAHQCFSDEAE